MEQQTKWIVYGSDGLGGEGHGCTRMRPEVAPARSWARFPTRNQWFHGIVRNLAGSEHCRTNVTVGTSSTHWHHIQVGTIQVSDPPEYSRKKGFSQQLIILSRANPRGHWQLRFCHGLGPGIVFNRRIQIRFRRLHARRGPNLYRPTDVLGSHRSIRA
jgi:hypothetical protein